MSAPLKVKMTITLSVDANVWLDYRAACQPHGIVPSHEVEEFMRQRCTAILALPLPQKEPDHA